MEIENFKKAEELKAKIQEQEKILRFAESTKKARNLYLEDSWRHSQKLSPEQRQFFIAYITAQAQMEMDRLKGEFDEL